MFKNFEKLNKNLKNKKNSERGDTLVTSLILMPVLIALLLTFIDMSIFMANRSQVQGIARDGARTVAIFGGNGTPFMQTSLEAAYGSTNSIIGGSATESCSKGVLSGHTGIECNILDSLKSSSLTSVDYNSLDVKCSPEKSNRIGEPVECTIEWKYNGIPGSALSFIQNSDESKKMFYDVTTKAVSESEVNLKNENLVLRLF